ncbi:MAG: hypothetical protein HC805_07310 [Alkalinema sp. RL_2_19]|nr:hypothetical protein [Alkalinema sp. RL_2_19]
MVNVSPSESVYCQSTSHGNLPRLLHSLVRAGIHYTVLSGVNHLPTPAGDSTEVVELQLSQTGYAKFRQVFVGQRCTALQDLGDYTFWDSRTGLTIHILIHSASAFECDCPSIAQTPGPIPVDEVPAQPYRQHRFDQPC